MAFISQIDCFQLNMKFWKFLGIWPMNSTYCYSCYSKIFVTVFVVIYDFLFTINFYFLPKHLDNFIEEMIFYFTELSVLSKILTFLLMHDKIINILKVLESDMFQPTTDNAFKLIEKAKKFNLRYWKIVAAVSVTSNVTHVLSPIITHLVLQIKLELPVCSYSFLYDETKEKFIYPLYFYQLFGIHFHMLYNLNIDTFFLGLMILAIAQLEILDENLRNITSNIKFVKTNSRMTTFPLNIVDDFDINAKLKKSVIHFDEVSKFCSLIEQVFGVTLFVQFSMASCIICVCLFRFVLPASMHYYVFLATYMFIMIIQIMVPCFFGTRIMEKSFLLSQALYDCNWIPKSHRFKSSLRVFVERASRPLSITGWKMFPLSLGTFTSIMNSAYSLFTLLRYMQTRE